MEDVELWLWLANGLGPCVNWMALWEAYGDIRAIWEDRLQLLRRGLISARQSDRLLAAPAQAMQRRRALHEQRGIVLLPFDAPAYPAQLRDTVAPPPILYVKGSLDCLQAPLMVGVVGTRHPSAYGVEATRQLCTALAGAGAVLVSGLAQGLDSEAHKAALRSEQPTVAVLGTDLDTVYPARNRQLQQLVAAAGALVSEYPCGEENVRYRESFVQRNRIIAGLSRCVCVAEARLHSGTMSTVRYALEYGRDVFAVPGSIFSALSEGTNHLIRQGAKPLTCAQDVLEEYGVAAPAPPPAKADPPAGAPPQGDPAAVYAALTGTAAMDAGALAAATGLPQGRLMAALTRLEMQGLVRQLPGRRFEKAV